MRVRLLRGDDDNTVLLVYPATRDEHCRVLDTVGCPGGSQGRSRPAGGAYVVTTAAQRERWGLADLAASGRVRVVDEAQALGLLCDGAAGLGAAEAPLAGAAAEVPPPAGGRSVASALESVRALAAPGARLDQVLDALEAAELPRPASETLRRSVRALGSDAAAVDEALDRAEMVLALPWRTREPERFDPAYVAQALDRTHGGLERVKTRLLQVLAACPQTRGPLTVEGVRRNRGAETDRPPALVVRPGPARTPTPVPCLAGPSGTGKTSLAVAVAEALGRTHVRVALGKGNAECLIRGVENGVTGRIVEGLHEAGVGNPVFILEELDRVASDAADALLDVLDPARRSAFRDEYLQVPFDLSAALWVVTATDAGGIPEPVRTRLEVIELPAYSEQEKLAIAQRYLLTRPFGQSQDTPPLALEPAAPARAVASDTARAGPAGLCEANRGLRRHRRACRSRRFDREPDQRGGRAPGRHAGGVEEGTPCAEARHRRPGEPAARIHAAGWRGGRQPPDGAGPAQRVDEVDRPHQRRAGSDDANDAWPGQRALGGQRAPVAGRS